MAAEGPGSKENRCATRAIRPFCCSKISLDRHEASSVPWLLPASEAWLLRRLHGWLIEPLRGTCGDGGLSVVAGPVDFSAALYRRSAVGTDAEADLRTFVPLPVSRDRCLRLRGSTGCGAASKAIAGRTNEGASVSHGGED